MEPTEQPPAAPSGRPPDPGGPVLSRRGLITATGAALAAAAGAGAVLTGRPGTPPSRTGGVDAAAFASPPPPAVDVPGRLARRRLGRLAWDGSILSLGAAYLDGPETVAAALDAGMNVIDTAPSSVYGASHEILAQVVPSRRDEVLLMSKVDGRTRDRADLNLRDSLERLRVDHLDVLMLHGLSYPDEVEQVFAPGGAMQTLLGAQRAGVARYIGFSAHRSSAVAVEALRRHDFDMVLAPVNPADYLIDDFTAALLPLARDRGTALMGMKALASGALPDTATAIRWALSQPWHTVTVGVSSREHVAIDVAAATDFSPLPPQQQADIVNRWRTYATPDRYYWRSGPGRIS